jgi:glycosyltransferase involved in cell wall biosynthesis
MTTPAFSGMLARLVEEVRQASQPCVLCIRHPLDEQTVENLLALPLVESIILQAENKVLLNSYPDRIGYYIRNGEAWHLPTRLAKEMIYAGRWGEFGARVAWDAKRAGIRKIRVVSGFYLSQRRSLIIVAFLKTFSSLLYRSGLLKSKSGFLFRAEQYWIAFKLRSLTKLLDSTNPLLQSGNERKIVFVGSTLGPGGAERQLSTTLVALSRFPQYGIHFLHHKPMHKPNDFYLSQLIQNNISYSLVRPYSAQEGINTELKAELEKQLMKFGDLGGDIASYTIEFIERRPETVHVWLDHMNVIAGLAALLAGVPRIFLSCRSLSPVHFSFNEPHLRPIYQLLAKFPNVTFLNNSNAGAADYARWLGLTPRTMKVIPNGFDFSSLPERSQLTRSGMEYKQKLGIPVKAPVVGVIMRISEEKRPLLWLQIAQRVSRLIPGTHFLIVGDGPMRAEMEVQAQANLPGLVHFPGHESDPFVPITAMNLFLLTSRVEGLPNVLIEAQAVGVPPVALDAGGAKETFLDWETGWLINSQDPSVAAELIASLLKNPDLLAEAAQKGQEFVRSRFNSETMVESTLSAYGYLTPPEMSPPDVMAHLSVS